MPNDSGRVLQTTRDLMKEGIRGFYRGGLPVFIGFKTKYHYLRLRKSGGALIRSAQFTTYSATLNLLPQKNSDVRVRTLIEYQVLILF